jgi:hypothetical protein
MNIFLYSEQTTHEAGKLLVKTIKTEKTPDLLRSFFCFLSCISYTRLVNIIPLFGTHPTENPFESRVLGRVPFIGYADSSFHPL